MRLRSAVCGLRVMNESCSGSKRFGEYNRIHTQSLLYHTYGNTRYLVPGTTWTQFNSKSEILQPNLTVGQEPPETLLALALAQETTNNTRSPLLLRSKTKRYPALPGTSHLVGLGVSHTNQTLLEDILKTNQL